MIAAILMGGASARFGSDKALAMGAGVRDATRAAGCDPVIAVGGSAGASLGLVTVPDRRPGEGPLAALGTVLRWAGPARVLVLPCDLPLLRGEHLRPLLDAAADPMLPDDVALVAQAAGATDGRGGWHGVAVWPGSCGRRIWAAVETGERSLRAALDLVSWRGVVIDGDALVDADTVSELARHRADQILPPSTPNPDSP